MVRAAAASSPHMMSLMTRPSLPFSSDRRMGRPTMEGYWNSGKFWEGKVRLNVLEARTSRGSLLVRRIRLSENRFLRQGLCD
jgi:hypothetical protein